MYKVVYNDIVIDVLDKIRYAKYLPGPNRTIATDKTSANCVIASNSRDRYHIKGVPIPEGSNLKTVSILKITDDEYNDIMKNVLKGESVADSGVRALKQAKIKEMRSICHERIIEGIAVLLSDGKWHHFELSLEDQVNLLEIKYLIDKGQKSFIYHETNGIHQEYSVDDMIKIIDAANEHKQKHLSYFNNLKNHIYTLDNMAEITNIKYNI